MHLSPTGDEKVTGFYPYILILGHTVLAQLVSAGTVGPSRTLIVTLTEFGVPNSLVKGSKLQVQTLSAQRPKFHIKLKRSGV